MLYAGMPKWYIGMGGRVHPVNKARTFDFEKEEMKIGPRKSSSNEEGLLKTMNLM